MVYLAEYFLLPSLLKFLQTFIQKDLSLETSDKYYTAAGSYDNHTILLNLVAQTCAKDFERIAEASSLLRCMYPDFFLRVLSMASSRLTEEQQSGYSVVVAKYWMIHKQSLSRKIFYQLTSSELLPAVEVSVAWKLLEFETDFIRMDKEDPDSKEESSLTCLQKRCIKALVENWEKISSSEAMTTSLEKIPAIVLRELLPLSISRAQQTVSSMNSRKRELEKSKKDMEDRYDKKNRSLIMLTDGLASSRKHFTTTQKRVWDQLKFELMKKT
jgi:hypothetical protein